MSNNNELIGEIRLQLPKKDGVQEIVNTSSMVEGAAGCEGITLFHNMGSTWSCCERMLSGG